MTVETFFEKFELFANVPGVVTKMRELVLEFAVTGRLSEYQSSDASISEFIEALSNGKARFSKNGRRGNIPIIQKEYLNIRPYNIPTHWAWVPLNKIGTISGGMTPSKDKSRFWNGDVNWFSSKDIKTNELTDAELKITREAVRATGLQVYPPGCLVMVARSGILKRTFPVSILRVEGTVNQDLKVLSPFVDGIERYLQIMLRGMTRYILTSLVKTGMTVQSLKYEEFETQVFPIPPLAEQKQIVAKVDELMVLCDRLEAEQKEREEKKVALAHASLARFAKAPNPANLNFLFHRSYDIAPAELRKTILTLAIQGKLVPQDPNEEPAEELLRMMYSERVALASEGLLKHTERVEALPNEPSSLHPPQWELVPLAALCISVTDGDHLPPPKSEIGIPFLVISNVRWGGINFEGCRHVTEEYFEKLDWTRKPRAGDILYTLVGSFGIPVLVSDARPFCVQRHIGILRPSNHLDRRYLAYALMSDAVFKKASYIATGIAQKTVPITGLRRITIPLPPLAEQRRIVAKVDQLMAQVDELEAQLAASRETGEKLLAALVAELTTLKKSPTAA